MANSLPTTSFISKRINPTTFLVTEDDIYAEQPCIYVKLLLSHLVITDTGCNSPRSQKSTLTSLRSYIETFPLSSNNNQPLNPPGPGQKQYVIICTHCHYDHILGIPQFLSAQPPPLIIASSNDRNFITGDLPTNSLCRFIPVVTPKYTITNWACHLSSLEIPKARIQFLQTPGHTPDSLSWYDIDEHTLYVGDTFYSRISSPSISRTKMEIMGARPGSESAIIFPNEGGNWIHYLSSLDMLLSFIQYQNTKLERQANLIGKEVGRVKVCCGHVTYNADAETMVQEVKGLMGRIIGKQVEVKGSAWVRGARVDFWMEDGNVDGSGEARYSVIAPRRICEEAREHFGIGK